MISHRTTLSITQTAAMLLVNFICCSTFAFSQTVDFKLNSPPIQLNAPEIGAFGLQIKKQLGANTLKTPLVVGAPTIDVRKSIFVTDENIMKKLTFAEVMDQLANQGGDPKIDKLTLFQQWWDSQTTAPGKKSGPHCTSIQNGFPYECPRLESMEANSDPFTNPTNDQGYSAIAYSNRPDLADPANPIDCGEARVVFARNSGKTNITNRNLIIFEARLPNPKPSLGLDGCQDIQQFWLELSNVDQEERGNRLKQFYLTGIPAKNIGPVIHVDHYASGTGQIRTNQFLNSPNGPFSWTLREFKIQKLQPGLRIVPVTVKTNPDPSLFSGKAPVDLQASFLARVSDQFDNIRGNGSESSAAAFTLRLANPTDDRFNSFESNESMETSGSVAKAFDPSSLLAAFINTKLAELKRPGSPGTALTADDVVQRIQTQTCAGCHQWSNNRPLGGGAGDWPSSLGFTHESEKIVDMEVSPEPNGGKRFGISATLRSNGFIPLRCVAMSRILNINEAPCGFQ